MNTELRDTLGAIMAWAIISSVALIAFLITGTIGWFFGFAWALLAGIAVCAVGYRFLPGDWAGVLFAAAALSGLAGGAILGPLARWLIPIIF